MKLYAIHIFIFWEHRLLRIKLLWSSNLVSGSIYKGYEASEEMSYNQFLNLAPLMPRNKELQYIQHLESYASCNQSQAHKSTFKSIRILMRNHHNKCVKR